MTKWDAAMVVFGVLAFAFMVALVLGLCRAASDADEWVQRALERDRERERTTPDAPKASVVVTYRKRERTTPWTSDHR